MQAQVLVLPVLRFGLRLGDQFVVGGGGFFGLACSVGVLDGNLLAFGLRRALRLGRALLSHGYYFPSLSSTTS